MKKIDYSDANVNTTYLRNFGVYSVLDGIPVNGDALAALVQREIALGRPVTTIVDGISFFLQNNPQYLDRYYDAAILAEAGIDIKSGEPLTDSQCEALPLPEKVSRAVSAYVYGQQVSDQDLREVVVTPDMQRLSVAAAPAVYRSFAAEQERRMGFLSRNYGLPEVLLPSWEHLSDKQRSDFQGRILDYVKVIAFFGEDIHPEAGIFNDVVAMDEYSDELARRFHDVHRYEAAGSVQYSPDSPSSETLLSFDDIREEQQAYYKQAAEIVLGKALSLGLHIDHQELFEEYRMRAQGEAVSAYLGEHGAEVVASYIADKGLRRVFDRLTVIDVMETDIIELGSPENPLRLGDDVACGCRFDPEIAGFWVRGVVSGQLEAYDLENDRKAIYRALQEEAERKGFHLYYVEGASKGLGVKDLPSDVFEGLVRDALQDISLHPSNYLGKAPALSPEAKEVLAFLSEKAEALSAVMEQGADKGVKHKV